MATARRPLLAGDERHSKKSDDRLPGTGVSGVSGVNCVNGVVGVNAVNGEHPLWRSVRQVRRRRIVFALLAVWLLYLFVRNIPTTLPPVSARYDHALPLQDYDGPVKFYKLPTTLNGFNYRLANQGTVLFAFSSLKSASALVSAACSMARQRRVGVHVAVMGRHEVDRDSVLALNGIAAADCPITWHDAQPNLALESTEARMTAAVEAALGYLHYSLDMQALLFDNSRREDDFFRAAISARAPLMGIPAIRVPDRDAWMLALDAPALRQWNEVSIEIVIRAPAESSASLIRLLKSIQAADYSALLHPKLTIELPAALDQGLSDFLARYRWPPRAPASSQALTLRRRLDAPAPGRLGAAAVSTLESFYPANAQAHVLVLSPDVELSPNYYHLLLFLILDAKHSARSSSISDQLLGISLESETFASGKASPSQAWALTQAPSGDAALYFGDKWIQIHNYATLRMHADPEWRKSVDSPPGGQLANSPAWMRATAELMQAMSYFMLQPVFTTASSPLVTDEDGHLVLKVTEPRSAREHPMLSASSVLGLLADDGNQGWTPETIPLFNAHGLAATRDTMAQERTSYVAQLARSVGGCASASIDLTSLTADSMSLLFCG
ncbi:hypothetical protein DV737_g5774, partial [Chaetothyriales sp. CBS 132003]